MLMNWIDSHQLRVSLYWSWIAISVLLLIAVLLPLVAPASWVHELAPRCLWKARFGRPCPACGLTTAFLAISRGAWGEAAHSNAAGIPLFTGFAVNSLCCLRSVLIRFLKVTI
jgi:Protein of unknown function (DUF2752)